MVEQKSIFVPKPVASSSSARRASEEESTRRGDDAGKEERNTYAYDRFEGGKDAAAGARVAHGDGRSNED